MDYFRNFIGSFFPGRGHRSSPEWLPPEEEEELPHHGHHEFFPWDRSSDDERMPQEFGGFPAFPRHFDDARKDMDDTFDELFRLFGVDNIPMFDPYLPPSQGEIHGRGQRNNDVLPANGNVRDKMLKGAGDSSCSENEEVNVRSQMLRRNPSYSGPRARSQPSDQNDVNWDSLLKEGGTVNDILDGSKRSSQPDENRKQDAPHTRSIFRYSSVTTTRRPDGTVETRRITRDESGNEKETIEIKGGPS